MATVKGQVFGETGEPLNSASVEIVNGYGKYLGQGIKTDNTGKFSFTSSILSGNYLLVSYAGLQPAKVEADKYMGSTYKRVTLFVKALNPVYVYPDKFPWWVIWILAIGIGAAAIKKKKKKKNG
jgi:hypothetical protein